MAGINFERTRGLIQQFKFKEVFIEELGWGSPSEHTQVRMNCDGKQYERLMIAELAGVGIFEITNEGGSIPDAKSKAELQKEIARVKFENLIIFIDKERSKSSWYWVKREKNKKQPREHQFFYGQSGDLLLGKLSSMHVDLSELDDAGNIEVGKVAIKLATALDVKPVIKKFYNKFAELRQYFARQIEGIVEEHDRLWFASVVLNRLMFIYFIQKKGFLNREQGDYLDEKFLESKQRGENRFYSEFLKALFFEGFAKPEEKRSDQIKELIGNIRYLNGGLFLPHTIELEHTIITIPDEVFQRTLGLFNEFSWNLDDTPGGKDNEINPAILGYIFEKYINQKAFGAFYTRSEITEYLCEQNISQAVLGRINKEAINGVGAGRHFESLEELLIKLDAKLCRDLLDALPRITILDPACGSGAFLVAAMKMLINVYGAVFGKIDFLNDADLKRKVAEIRREHASLNYYIRKEIITHNLFGVDIMEEASEIARLRLFLALVAAAENESQLEPLPNIDFNILHGNSLIGLLRVNEEAFNQAKVQPEFLQQKGFKQKYQQSSMLQKSYRQLVEEKQRKIEHYRQAAGYQEHLQSLRDEIDQIRQDAYQALNDLLLSEFSKLGIKKEISQWDEKVGKEGKKQKRAVQLHDIEKLEPFHWGYEFDEVMNIYGGFDVIITNPPWDIYKPNAKEFFEEFSDLITKKKMQIEDFEKEKTNILKDKAIRSAWLDYQDDFPHVSAWFRKASQFMNQISVIDGKKAGSDINLYKLFMEQCFNLLKPKGLAGMVVPSGIHTDLGTMQLRKMLFEECRMTGIFGIENRAGVFEDVHRSFKFDMLTFEKGGETSSFPAAFMRHDVKELDVFPRIGALEMSVELIKRISPDSFSVAEFQNEMDVNIAEKILRFPLLGEEVDGKRYLVLNREFDMTNDSQLFKTEPGPGCLPLYEGKMIWQFDSHYTKPRYWIDEKEGRKKILGRGSDYKQNLGYQSYRLGVRSIASNTNERTLINTIVPMENFCGNSLLVKIMQLFFCKLRQAYPLF